MRFQTPADPTPTHRRSRPGLKIALLVLRAGLLVGACGGSVLWVDHEAAERQVEQPALPTRGDQVEVDTAALLIARYNCWTGAAPAKYQGQFPGHVVVTDRAGDVQYSARLVGPALDQVIDGVNNGLVVHGFCP